MFQRVGVRGTPGIGKTMLGYYVLWRLLTDPTYASQSVQYVVHQHKQDLVYTIPRVGDVTVRVGTRAVRKMCLAVRDSVKWEQYHGQGSVFFVASPNNSVYRRFESKDDGSHVHAYLPVWTWEELCLFRRSAPDLLLQVRC
jgi:hypothetical protein